MKTKSKEKDHPNNNTGTIESPIFIPSFNEEKETGNAENCQDNSYKHA